MYIVEVLSKFQIEWAHKETKLLMTNNKCQVFIEL